jgi:hypothetical protein
LTDKDVYLSYLPLAHAFDRIFEEWFISHGAAIGFWRGVKEYTCLLPFILLFLVLECIMHNISNFNIENLVLLLFPFFRDQTYKISNLEKKKED